MYLCFYMKKILEDSNILKTNFNISFGSWKVLDKMLTEFWIC